MMSNYRLMMSRCRRQPSLQNTAIASSPVSSPLITILCSSSSYHTTSTLLQPSRNDNDSRVHNSNREYRNNNRPSSSNYPSSSHYRNRPHRSNRPHNHQGQTIVRIDYIPPSSPQQQQQQPLSPSTKTTNILQTCLTPLHNSFKPPDHHSNFNICFLGTGGNMPSPFRNTSSTILSLGSQSFVFDVGEGTQRQLLFSRLSSTDICKIFITHMHGDHVLGLISLLLQIDLYSVQQQQEQQQQPKKRRERTTTTTKKETTVELYGPPGLYGFIKSQLLFIESKLKMTLIVHELMGSRAGRKQRSRHYDHDEDIDWEYIGSSAGNGGGGGGGGRHLKIHRKEIYPDNHDNDNTNNNNDYIDYNNYNDNGNDDLTWTISQPSITRDMITHPQTPNYGRSVLPNDYHAGPYRQYHIHAAEVHHNPGLPTFGYVVREMTPPQKIDPRKAMECGVAPSFKYHLLKNGFSVRSDDDKREVRPEDVLLIDESSSSSRARKLVVLGDNCGVSRGMVRIGCDADVLVTEATVEEDYRERDAIRRGHSTGAMAGRLARQLKAKTVFLNHFGGGSNMNSLQQLRHNVEVNCNTNRGRGGGGQSVVKDNNCMVVTAHDFMEVVVPYGGFDDDDDDDVIF